jgi:hypothetical protein
VSRYAKRTRVDSTKTAAEIQRTLERYGASRFAHATEPGRAMVMFEAHDRRVMFELPLPSVDDYREGERATRSGGISYVKRSDSQATTMHTQEVRRRWRALGLVIKAKLEAVGSGIVDFETEFLGHIVLANKMTVAQWLKPQLAETYQKGLPPMLPSGTR